MTTIKRLFIPIEAHALVLAQKKNVVDISPQLRKLNPLQFLGESLTPDIYGTDHTKTLGKGIHIHWNLPKALRHARQVNGEHLEFPFAPNRWFITRIQTNADHINLPSKSWIVESDYTHENLDEDDANDVAAWLKYEQNTYIPSSIGRSAVYSAEWKEGATLTPFLKAIGPAHSYFSSFYPGCQNVYGFYDDLKNIASGYFTYIISGWYADKKLDPLYISEDPQINAARAEQLAWFKQEWVYEGAEYPEQSLFYASLHQVYWNPREYDKDGVPLGDINVYVGNTSAEALSTQICNSNGEQRAQVEELLTSLQYQLFDDNSHIPSLHEIGDETHRRSFTSSNAGLLWEVKKSDKNIQKEEAKKEEEQFDFPDIPLLTTELKVLNTKQTKLNKLLLEKQSLQQEYYLLWYKQVMIDKIGEAAQYQDPAIAQAVIKMKLEETDKKINTLASEINELLNKIKNYTAFSGIDPDFKIQQNESSRFWKPNDPVVLLSGAGIGALPNNSAERQLKCRTIDDISSYFNFTVRYNNANIDVVVPDPVRNKAIWNIEYLNTTHADVPLKEIKALTKEALLYSSSMASYIALLAHQNANMSGVKEDDVIIKEYTKNVVLKLQQDLLKLSTAATEAEAATRDQVISNLQKQTNCIVPAAICIKQWTQAWMPMFLNWEVQWFPDLPQTEIKHWELQNYTLYKYRNNSTTPVNENITRYTGLTPLTDAGFKNLERLLPDDITKKYGELNIISQSLGGLHLSLLTRALTIQLPPFKYNKDSIGILNDTLIIDDDLLKIIGENGYIYGSTPGEIKSSENLFHPLRGGQFQFTKLSIIDSFGQEKMIINTHEGKEVKRTPILSASLRTDGKAMSDLIPLGPRIIQPSRLLAHWKDLNDDIIYDGSAYHTDSVIGWVVPNYIENNLMIYDGEGNELLIMQIASDPSEPGGVRLNKWPFPGYNEIPTIQNIYLKNYIQSTQKGTVAKGLLDLALQVHLGIGNTPANSSSNTAAVTGQPLALVRCSLKLELEGLAALNQEWEYTINSNNGEIDKAKFPFYIGNYMRDKDGLLAFMKDDDTHLYITNRAPQFEFQNDPTFILEQAFVNLSTDEKECNLLLLIDPAAGLHICSGILPTKYMELSPHRTKKSLEKIDFNMMVSPMIADKNNPTVPVSSLSESRWKWIHKTGVNVWSDEKDLNDEKNNESKGFNRQQIFEGWLKLSKIRNTKK
jgi:hypothetical protein